MARNTWPGWECVRLLGAGSFGKVYEIRRTEFGREFSAALKVITVPPDDSSLQQAYSEGMDKESITAYFRSYVEDITAEFAMMAELKGHTNIVSYEDHMVQELEGQFGWEILIRMELLTPLLDWIKVHPLTETDVIRLGIDMCRALEVCHMQNILHRDIKPENIFLNRLGDYKLGDFGIAKQTERTLSALSQKGTYTYMAPEVYLGKPYGKGADLYSLGTVLYRFLNGQRTPFLPHGTIRYADREEALRRRMSGEAVPPPLAGSDMLREAVLKAIAFERADRFENASEMRAALEACLDYCSAHGDSLADHPSELTSRQPSEDSVTVPEQTPMPLPENPVTIPEQTPKLPDSETEPKQAEPPAPENAADSEPTPKPAPAEAVRQPAEPPKKKKWLMPAVIGAAALLLTGAIAFGVSHLGGSGSKPDTVSSGVTDGNKAAVSSAADSSGGHPDSSTSGSSSSKSADSSSKQSGSSSATKAPADFKGDDWEITATTNMLILGDSTNIALYSDNGGQWIMTNADGMTWSSSDESVLKVTPGIVTAVGTGAARIDCDYGKWHYEQWITVAEPDTSSGVSITTDLSGDALTVNRTGSAVINVDVHALRSYNIYYYAEPAPADEDPLFSFYCTWEKLGENSFSLTVHTVYAAEGTRRVRVACIDQSDPEHLHLLAEKEITVKVSDASTLTKQDDSSEPEREGDLDSAGVESVEFYCYLIGTKSSGGAGFVANGVDVGDSWVLDQQGNSPYTAEFIKTLTGEDGSKTSYYRLVER